MNKGRYRHGLCKHPMYNTWNSMKQRCLNPKDDSWPFYGGRGIKVCERWMDFVNFYEDNKNRWRPDLVLERVEPDGDYELSNTEWITVKENARRKRPRGPNRGSRHGLRPATLSELFECGLSLGFERKVAAHFHPLPR